MIVFAAAALACGGQQAGLQPTATLEDIASNYSGLEGYGQLLGAPPDEDHVLLPATVDFFRVKQETEFLIVTGRIQNNTDGYVTFARAHLLIYDASGRPVREEVDLYADKEIIPPGGWASFKLIRDLQKIAGTPDHAEVEAFALPDVDTGHRIDIIDVQTTTDEFGNTVITGALSNTGSVECTYAKVVVMLLDDEAVMDSSTHSVSDALAPGDSANFSVKVQNDSNLPVAFDWSCRAP